MLHRMCRTVCTVDHHRRRRRRRFRRWCRMMYDEMRLGSGWWYPSTGASHPERDRELVPRNEFMSGVVKFWRLIRSLLRLLHLAATLSACALGTGILIKSTTTTRDLRCRLRLVREWFWLSVWANIRLLETLIGILSRFSIHKPSGENLSRLYAWNSKMAQALERLLRFNYLQRIPNFTKHACRWKDQNKFSTNAATKWDSNGSSGSFIWNYAFNKAIIPPRTNEATTRNGLLPFDVFRFTEAHPVQIGKISYFPTNFPPFPPEGPLMFGGN